ncbi:MAG TPA: hypothetical protein VGJ84_19735 [Polyangiaceae bacterium]|jgi:hypothetical protein
MRRRVWIGLLALGTVVGYGLGFASLRHHHAYGWDRGHWGRYDDGVAEACARAAERVYSERAAKAPDKGR